MEYVIVTGANGFIGKTLVNALLEKGYQVVALDITTLVLMMWIASRRGHWSICSSASGERT